MENKGANSGFISSQPMKNITGGSQINLVADEKIDMNSNAANIEKKLDSLHSLLENQMNPGSNSAKRPAAASVMHEETYAQDTGKKIVKERENANYKFLQLIYKKLVDNEVDSKYADEIIADIEASLKKESNIDSILSAVYQKIILKLGEPRTISLGDKPKVIFLLDQQALERLQLLQK